MEIERNPSEARQDSWFEVAAIALGRLDEALYEDDVWAAYVTTALVEEAVASAERDGYSLVLRRFLRWYADETGPGHEPEEWEGMRLARDAARGMTSCLRLDPLQIPTASELFEIGDRMVIGDLDETFEPERYAGRMDNWQAVSREITEQESGLARAALLVKSFHDLAPVGATASFPLARALVPIFLQGALDLRRPVPWISRHLKPGRVSVTAIGIDGPRQRQVNGYQEVAVKGSEKFWCGFFAQAVARAAAAELFRARRAHKSIERLSARLDRRRAGSVLIGLTPKLVSVPSFRAGDVARWTGCKPVTADKACRELQQLGVIEEMTGRKRYKVYWLPDLWH